MNALEKNRFTKAWAQFGRSLPRPRAVLAISAHWYGAFSGVTAMAKPRTIHDFAGFPDPLRSFQYRAPGSPELAAEVAELVKPTQVHLDRDSWGLDHGTWSVLCHVFPNADIPVVQLSIDARRSFDQHMAVGAALEPLRRSGVLIVGSGNVVHNLSKLRWRETNAEFDWNRRFDRAARSAMAKDPSQVAALRQHPDYRLAVPTPDHFIPLLYIAGVASAAGTGGDVLVEGAQMGSLSMTSFVVR
jgi:4,5-DOPA dioxygenase extradiol